MKRLRAIILVIAVVVTGMYFHFKPEKQKYPNWKEIKSSEMSAVARNYYQDLIQNWGKTTAPLNSNGFSIEQRLKKFAGVGFFDIVYEAQDSMLLVFDSSIITIDPKQDQRIYYLDGDKIYMYDLKTKKFYYCLKSQEEKKIVNEKSRA